MSTDNCKKITEFGPTFRSRLDLMGIRFNNDGGNGTGAGDPTPPNSGSATEDESLGEAGKKALKAERDRANAAERELAAYKKKEQEEKDKELSESQRLARELETERADKARLAAQTKRYEVASSIEGFPLALVSRLQGDDEASIKADAEALMKQFNVGGPKIPKADPSAGKKQSASGLSNAEQFESVVDSLFENQ